VEALFNESPPDKQAKTLEPEDRFNVAHPVYGSFRKADLVDPTDFHVAGWAAFRCERDVGQAGRTLFGDVTGRIGKTVHKLLLLKVVVSFGPLQSAVRKRKRSWSGATHALSFCPDPFLA
jgi:hypothetical protein